MGGKDMSTLAIDNQQIASTIMRPSKPFQRKTCPHNNNLPTAEATALASSRVCAMKIPWLLLPVLLTGCTSQDAAGVKIDLSQLNWQTGVIAALLLWVDKSSLWAPIAKMGQPIVNLLQKFGILKTPATPDTTPNKLTSAEALAIIVDLINRTKNPALKDQLLATVSTAAEPGVATDGK